MSHKGNDDLWETISEKNAEIDELVIERQNLINTLYHALWQITDVQSSITDHFDRKRCQEIIEEIHETLTETEFKNEDA